MEKEEKQKETFLDLVSRHWFLILFIGGMIVTWGRYETKISYIESEVQNIKADQKSISGDIRILVGDVREVKTSLEFIKDKL